jgi:hypothetical protein
MKGSGAGGDQQAVVFGATTGGFVPSSAEHLAAHAVDLRHLAAQMQGDAVLGVPLQRVEDDLVEGLLAGQHRRQQDAVVVGVRLGAEHGDLVQVGARA